MHWNITVYVKYPVRVLEMYLFVPNRILQSGVQNMNFQQAKPNESKQRSLNLIKHQRGKALQSLEIITCQ